MKRPTKQRRAKGAATTTARLTPRQAAFCRAYFAGPSQGNALQSARAAGYGGNDETLAAMGSQLFRNSKVAEELARLRKLADDETIADAKERLLMLSKMVRGEILAPVAVKANGTIVYGPPKHGDRTRAAELIAKMRGELRETHDVDVTVTGPNGGPIQMQQHAPPPVARAELIALVTAELGAVEAERVVRRMLGEPEPTPAELVPLQLESKTPEGARP